MSKKPLGVAVGEGSVWVTNTSGSSVSRIDPHTNAVIATIRVGEQPSGITVSDGIVWVVTFGGRLSTSGTLSRIDPKTNTVTASIKISGGPNALTAHGNDVWVTSQLCCVVHIDAATSRVTKLADNPTLSGDAVRGSVLWVADNSHAALIRLDARTGDLLGRTQVGNGPVIFGAGVDPDGAIWVSNASEGSVIKVKP